MNLKSRKLIVMLILTLIVIVFAFMGKVTSAEMIDWFKWSLGIYSAGNVMTKFTGVSKE